MVAERQARRVNKQTIWLSQMIHSETRMNLSSDINDVKWQRSSYLIRWLKLNSRYRK